MKATYFKRWIFLGLLSLTLLAPTWAVAQTEFSMIVVFGDSLSDPGNAFILKGAQSTPPYSTLDPLLIPEAPYAKGGHHFSNGATWVEQYARSRGLAGNTRPAFEGAGLEATNYATGGARARNDGIVTNSHLSDQVSAFLSEFGGAAPPDALYVVQFGGNDIRDALAVLPDSGQASTIIGGALSTIGDKISALYASGARKFFVWTAPDLALTPAVRTLDELSPGAAGAAEFLTQQFNSNLDAVLGSLAGLPGIEIVRFDINQRLQDVVANPGSYGLSVVDTACVTPNVAPFTCKQPDDYLFWDGIHPTKVMHAIIAHDAATALGH